MRISIFTRIYNRAHLLKYSLRALKWQIDDDIEVDLHVADSDSTDGLDDLLAARSRDYGWKITKYQTRSFKQHFQHSHNCPAAHYNAMVAVCEAPFIIKIDPEFVFITDGFVRKSLDLLAGGAPKIIMPLPHHVHEFEHNSLEDIRKDWERHEYPTHINAQTASHCNVYYGCMFNRKAYLDLGGIDIRFGGGIGSEDDHFLDQWRRKYGRDHVITLLEEHGLHMWHGGFSAGVPQHLYHHVNYNASLRRSLSSTYPNGGNFHSVNYPNMPYQEWRDGVMVVEDGIKTVTTDREGVSDEGIVIGYVDRQ